MVRLIKALFAMYHAKRLEKAHTICRNLLKVHARRRTECNAHKAAQLEDCISAGEGGRGLDLCFVFSRVGAASLEGISGSEQLIDRTGFGVP